MTSKDILVEVQKRTTLGKGLKGLRAEGKIPAVIHDHGKESLHVVGDYREISKAFAEAGKHHTINLSLDGKPYLTIIKDAQFEPVKHRLDHVVFQSIKQNEKVSAEVPVVLVGEIPAERKSLIVLRQLDMIEVHALPKDLPDQLEVDASSLENEGDRLTVADIKVPAGVTFDTTADHVLATVEVPKDQIAEADAAAKSLADDADKPVVDEPATEAATEDKAEAKS